MVWQLLQKAAWKTGLQLFSRLLTLLHQLWHEVTGSLFIVLGVGAIPSTIKAWRAPDMRSRAVIATLFIILMLYFGVTSFIRARRVAKGQPE